MGPPRPVPLPERPPRGKLRTDSTYDWREIGEQVSGTRPIPRNSLFFSLLAGNLPGRPVRCGLRSPPTMTPRVSASLEYGRFAPTAGKLSTRPMELARIESGPPARNARGQCVLHPT